MATWYVDPENGTDSAASVGTGDSFATRRKTFTNLVAGVLAAGDEVRVIGSPAPTSIGPATWTDCSLVSQQTFSIVSSTNATPIVVTISSANYTTLNPAVGDTIVIYNHSTNTNANGTWKISAVNGTDSVTLVNADGSASVGNGVGGATGTLKWFTNSIVTLSTACTKNIAVCGNRGTVTNWTASANVTSTVYTTEAKEGGECISLAVASGFTTGMAAYYATGTLDLSGYQQVSFWVKQTVGTVGAAGAARLRLCTDTAGATPVHDINIPYLGTTNVWVPVVVDLATNLNSAIKSISLDIVTDNGAQTFLIDNVIACKAASSGDSLNLTSLISKDPGDRSYGDTYESYWAVQSINGTRIVLEHLNSSYPFNTSTVMRGYSGTTETVTTYKRETLKPAVLASGTVNASTVDGTSGSHITYSGGWDRTAMTTQNLETWVSGINGVTTFFNPAHVFLDIDKIHTCRFSAGLSLSILANDFTVGDYYSCSSNQGFQGPSVVRTTADFISVVAAGGTPINLGYQTTATVLVAHSNNGVGVSATAWSSIGTVISRRNTNGFRSGHFSTVDYVKAEFNDYVAGGGLLLSNYAVIREAILNYNGYAISTISEGAKVLSGSCSNSVSGLFFGPQATCYLKDFVVNDSVEMAPPSSEGGYSFNYLTYFENYDGVAGDMHALTAYGEINSDTGVTHGDSTFSWRFSPTTTYASDRASLLMPIWKKACAASVPVTFKAWFRRDNTGLTGKLLVRGIYPGVTTDVSDSISVIADTWEQLSVTVTPTEDCVIEVFASFYGGVAYNGYVADLSEA